MGPSSYQDEKYRRLSDLEGINALLPSKPAWLISKPIRSSIVGVTSS